MIMHKLNVLLLGWEFLPAMPLKPETGCYHLAQALAKRVNLTVLVPQAGLDFPLPQGELTGLDQVNLAEIPALPPASRPLPYAGEAYIRTDIPLYGAAEPHRHAEKPTFPESSPEISYAPITRRQEPEKKEESVPLFAYQNFQELGLATQVIEYARYTSRWAAHRSFDIIYAFHHKTFLAATELKLVSGKKLILQVDGCNQEPRPSSSKGWMYELEKQALQQADYILTDTEQTAQTLVQKFNLSPAILAPLEESTENPSPTLEKEPAATSQRASLARRVAEPGKSGGQLRSRMKENWTQKAAIIRIVMKHLMTR